MIVINYKGVDGVRRGLLLKCGNKYTHVLLLDNPLRVTKLPNREAKYIQAMDWYPVKKALKVFRRCAKAWHGSIAECPKGVRLALRGKY